MRAIQKLMLFGFVVLACSGCRRSLVAHACDCRQNASLLASDDRFSIWASTSTLSVETANELLDFMGRTLEHYEGLVGPLPSAVYSVYLHPEGEKLNYLGSGGVAYGGDLSTDVVWSSNRPSRKTIAHELAHLMDYQLHGNTIVRPFITEGFAEFLADSLPFCVGEYDPVPGTSFDDLRPKVLYPSIVKHAFAGANWESEFWDARSTHYNVAASTTEILIELMGMERYLNEFYPAVQMGTSDDAEDLLLEMTGHHFSSIEAQILERAKLNDPQQAEVLKEWFGEENIYSGERPTTLIYCDSDSDCPSGCGCVLSPSSQVKLCSTP